MILFKLLSEVESKTQYSRPMLKAQKNLTPRTALPMTDPLKAKDRNPRGQEPRTPAQMFSKKKVFKIFFQDFSKKKGFQNFFQTIYTILTIQKWCCEPRTVQFLRFVGFDAKTKDLIFQAKAKDFKMCP